MQLKILLLNIILIWCLSHACFSKEEPQLSKASFKKSDAAQTPIPGFHFITENWTSVNKNPYLHSFQKNDGLSQLHLGTKPFFESVVPAAEELHRTFFQEIASNVALDWKTLGIQPGDQRLHKPEIIEVWSNRKVAIDIIPVFINLQRRHYAVATFLYRNYPVYFTSKQINDRNTLKKHLTSAFHLD